MKNVRNNVVIRAQSRRKNYPGDRMEPRSRESACIFHVCDSVCVADIMNMHQHRPCMGRHYGSRNVSSTIWTKYWWNARIRSESSDATWMSISLCSGTSGTRKPRRCHPTEACKKQVPKRFVNVWIGGLAKTGRVHDYFLIRHSRGSPKDLPHTCRSVNSSAYYVRPSEWPRSNAGHSTHHRWL